MRAGRSFEGRGGLVLIKRGGVGGGGGAGGQFVRGSYKSFEGINLTVLGRKKKKRKKHQSVCHGERGLGRGWGGWSSSICAWKLYIILRG